jgi:hypothetical protein
MIAVQDHDVATNEQPSRTCRHVSEIDYSKSHTKQLTYKGSVYHQIDDVAAKRQHHTTQSIRG